MPRNPACLLEIGGAKKYPGECNQIKCEKDPRCVRNSGSLIQPKRLSNPLAWLCGQARHDQVKTVKCSPNDIRPACPMPHSADEKNDQNVDAPPGHGDSIAAKRDIKVIAKPGGKRD